MTPIIGVVIGGGYPINPIIGCLGPTQMATMGTECFAVKKWFSFAERYGLLQGTVWFFARKVWVLQGLGFHRSEEKTTELQSHHEIVRRIVIY